MATPDIYRVMLLTLYNLGIRQMEARNIKWENIDFENRTITVTGKRQQEENYPMEYGFMKNYKNSGRGQDMCFYPEKQQTDTKYKKSNPESKGKNRN